MEPISVIDLNWVGHRRAIATAVLRSSDSVALIDPGPSSCLSTLREQLGAQGLRVSDLQAILLTHIHLDHAGATGTLVRENPNLKVYVHEIGAKHMADPSRLLSSATRLYGDTMQYLYGEFLPVPHQNLCALQGKELLSLAGRKLQVLYTPGHASVLGHPFILPATPPPDISLELWDASMDAIAALAPRRLFLTHFSFSDHPREHLAVYRDRLHHWSGRVASIMASGIDEAACIQKFSEEVAADAAKYLTPAELAHYSFAAALNLSWLGLARYHRKRAEAASASDRA